MSSAAFSQLHQPRLAEIIADTLRQRILEGQLADGQLLPNQEHLVSEFTVSRPSLREALRILEAEGLITVQRGNVGGAVVHLPQARHAAYTLALVLQARHARLDDVGNVLKRLEGTCAGLCAARPDRVDQIVPILRDCNARAAVSLDDEMSYVGATADFHRNMVNCCGSETMRLIVGSLESMWLSHVHAWAKTTTQAGIFPNRDYRARGLAAHERITDLIAAGDIAESGRQAEAHFDPQQFYLTASDASWRVDASTMRAPGRTATPGDVRGDH